MERQTYLEIDSKAFIHNINIIKELVKPKEIMPVIKANAYGTHINKNLNLIKNFNIVAVAIVKEAVELRNLGFKNEIFVLNQPFKEEIADIIKYNITVGVASYNFLEELIKTKKDLKIHLELETGMGRTGINYEDLNKFIEKVKNSNIEVEGVYTHFAVADTDQEFTKEQINKFTKGLNLIKQNFNLKYIHTDASNGIVNFNTDICNLTRPGIIMYGYNSCENSCKLLLKPVAKLISKISFIKEIDKNISISYGRKFISQAKMKVATVSIGYADGIRRALSNVGNVVIKGQKVPIIGTICMDSFMVDVTNIDCQEGDQVYIFDNEIITLDEIAKQCNTINYEILSTISERVPRVFKN